MCGDSGLHGWQVQKYGSTSADEKRCGGSAIFHGAQRCATCMAIEKNTNALLESAYAEQLKSGKLEFRSVDISKEGALAEKYGVSWSSLILVDYDKDGKECSTNLTEFAFGYARTAPNKFKAGLSEQISEMLNN